MCWICGAHCSPARETGCHRGGERRIAGPGSPGAGRGKAGVAGREEERGDPERRQPPSCDKLGLRTARQAGRQARRLLGLRRSHTVDLLPCGRDANAPIQTLSSQLKGQSPLFVSSRLLHVDEVVTRPGPQALSVLQTLGTCPVVGKGAS